MAGNTLPRKIRPIAVGSQFSPFPFRPSPPGCRRVFCLVFDHEADLEKRSRLYNTVFIRLLIPSHLGDFVPSGQGFVLFSAIALIATSLPRMTLRYSHRTVSCCQPLSSPCIRAGTRYRSGPPVQESSDAPVHATSDTPCQRLQKPTRTGQLALWEKIFF